MSLLPPLECAVSALNHVEVIRFFNFIFPYFLFRERPQLNSLTLDYERLRQLPDGTFGREYVRGMDVNVGKTLCETTNIIWRFYLY